MKSEVIVLPKSSLKKLPSVSYRHDIGTISVILGRAMPPPNLTQMQTRSPTIRMRKSLLMMMTGFPSMLRQTLGRIPPRFFLLGSNCKKSCKPKRGLSSKTFIWEHLEGDYVAELGPQWWRAS